MNHGLINIHIIATNDIHGALFSETDEANIMKAASYIKMIEQASEHVMVIDNGNALSGSLSTYYFSRVKPDVRNPMISIMNRIPYDASGISPNEFRYGMAYFNRAQALANFPFLSANILHHRTKEPYFGNPYTIKHFAGMKIGIIGLTSIGLMASKSAEMIEDFEIEETIQAAKRWIRHMHDKENPDFVIALYHGGLSELAVTTNYKEYISSEAEAIIQATEGIDVMITGHQKKTLTKRIADTLFIQAGSNMSHLCHLQLTFKERTNTFELVASNSELIDVSDYPEEHMLKHMVFYEEQMYRQWTETEIGESEDLSLLHYQDFFSDHPFKQLLHDLLASTGAEITCCHLPHIKAKGLKGTVTERTLYESYINIDHPIHLSLTGETIIKIMERSAAALVAGEKNSVQEAMMDPTTVTDWHGFDYQIDLTQPIGSRIQTELKQNKLYLVAATDYMYRQYKDLIVKDAVIRIHKFHMMTLLKSWIMQKERRPLN